MLPAKMSARGRRRRCPETDRPSPRPRPRPRPRSRPSPYPSQRPCPSPSPSPSPSPLPVRTRNQRGAAITGDWTDVETGEDLRFRLNMFNLGSNVADNQVVESATAFLQNNPKFVQELIRICREKRKQLGDLDNMPKPDAETSIKNQIQRALDYYKDEVKGGEYEFMSCEKMAAPSLLVAHTNFYARPKGSDSSPELFFAVLENGSPQTATHCCKLDPSYYFVDGSKARKLSKVLQCEHVKCKRCMADVVVSPCGSVII